MQKLDNKNLSIQPRYCYVSFVSKIYINISEN